MQTIQYWQWVTFASFGGLVILLMMLSLIAAVIWKEKFQKFNLQNDEYLQQVNIELKEYRLSVKKIEYELPKGEIAYLNQTATAYFQISSKLEDDELFFKSKFKFTERRYFNPKKIHSKNVSIILTNRHILIETENEFLKQKIEKLYIRPLTFSNGLEIFNGHELVIEHIRFLIYTQSSELWLVFKKIKGD